MAYLLVIPHEGPPKRHELTGDRIWIGRGASCGVRLESAAVGRIHAEIRQYGDIFLLEDMQSRPGTMLNGVTLGEPAMLRDGDQIRIGPVWLTFHQGDGNA